MSLDKKTDPWKWRQVILLALIVVVGVTAYFFGVVMRPRAVAPAPEAAEDEGTVAHTERFLAAIEGCLETTGLKYSNAVTGEVECNPSESEPEAVIQPEPAVSIAVAECFTEGEFEELIGVRGDIVGTEPCAFHWRGDPQTLTPTQICPEGWNCTVGVADWQGDGRQTVVFVGDDELSPMAIFAATWRMVGVYPSTDTVHEPCAFLGKVQEEGRNADPQWTATAGNFSCP